MYSTLPNCLKSSCVMGWTFISMQTTPSCMYNQMTHLWPSSVWTRASSTLKPGLKPAAWDWTRPRHKSCGSCKDNSWPRWILIRCHLWQPAVDDVGTGFSRVSYLLLPVLAAASACSMPVWGRRQNPDLGFRQYSAGLLQLAVLRQSRWFDESPAVSSERRRTSHHRSQAVRAHHASSTSAALAGSPQTSGFQDIHPRRCRRTLVHWLATLLCT